MVGFCDRGIETSIKGEEVFEQLSDYEVTRRTLFQLVTVAMLEPMKVSQKDALKEITFINSPRGKVHN
jgi:hypothetical protein